MTGEPTMNMPITSVRAWAFCLVLLAPTLALAAGPATRSTYKVEAGDTLDKVIRKTMPDSPLRADILRNAFVQQNPQAFTKSPPRSLVAGAVLNVPSHDDLLRTYLVPGQSMGSSGMQRGGGYSTADMNMSERKNWVRFP
jgi:Tfp pilus assembly protein FimV